MRQITVAGDSTGFDDTGYPVRLNEPWAVSKVRDENDQNQYTYTISSSFSDIDHLNKEIEYRGDSLEVNSTAALVKKFRWFYTFYRYEETFYPFFPFNDPPLSDFLSPEEAQLYQSGADSGEVEEKLEDYAQENFYKAYSNVLQQVADTHPELGLASRDIADHKAAIIDILSEWAFDSDDPITAFLTAGDSLLHPLKSLLTVRSEFAELDSTLSHYLGLLEKIIAEDYRVEVEMPGRIFDSNANNSVREKMVAWEFDSDRFHFVDYPMWVESRKWNIIPVVVTALILLLGLLTFVASWQRNRRRKLAEQGIEWRDRKRFILKWPFSVILLIIGAWLTFWFTWLFILFNTNPTFLWLDIFDASPAENALFIFLIIIGMILILIGIRHLVLSRSSRKA